MVDTWVTRAGSATNDSLEALAARLRRSGWRADQLTYLALASGVAAGLFFLRGHDRLGLLALVISALLDAIDGKVARQGSESTAWGGVLDLTFDRIVEASILLGVAIPRPELHVACLVVAATWYINISVFLAVGGATERHGEKVIDYPPGLLERGESLLFLLAILWLPSVGSAVAYFYAGLELVTGWQRFRHGRAALQGQRARRPAVATDDRGLPPQNA